MGISEQLKEIVSLKASLPGGAKIALNPPARTADLEAVERLIGEALPSELLELYGFADGQQEDSEGLFHSERFISMAEAIKQLEFSVSLVKPERPAVDDPVASERIVRRIVERYIELCTKKNFLGVRERSYRITGKFGVSSLEGPYVYRKDGDGAESREAVRMRDSDDIYALAGELFELEKASWNWDTVAFEISGKDDYTIRREFYDFDNELGITSTPEGAIRKKYFHYKWLPVLSDGSGNYIGVDLDPGPAGRKGQVIIFGRDEEALFVVADGLPSFFDWVIEESEDPESAYATSRVHLHDLIRKERPRA